METNRKNTVAVSFLVIRYQQFPPKKTNILIYSKTMKHFEKKSKVENIFNLFLHMSIKLQVNFTVKSWPGHKTVCLNRQRS